MNKEYLVKQKSLTGLTKWMNETFKKHTGKPFNTTDVQNYIRRGNIPEYLGNNEVERDTFEEAKLYNIVK